MKCNMTFAPPPDIPVSEWVTPNINMSTKHDSIGGPYIPYSYQEEILNISSDPSVREIVLMTSAQVGKTWTMMLIAGHRIATQPSGIVWAMASKESVEFLSSSRFTPMVEESDILSRLVAEKQYKSDKNKTTYKDFIGGWIRFVTAGSADNLSSAPAPLALADEVDKWKVTQKEGCPLGLLQARQKKQVNPLLVAASTPSIKGASKIEALYEASDKRRYYVPCFHCDEEHLLIWDNVNWDSQKFDTEAEYEDEKKKLLDEGTAFWESTTTKHKLHFPDTAQIMCPKCGTLISDYEKNIMIDRGRWIAERPFMGTAGFHLNELYSPSTSLADIALDYLKKKDDPAEKQVFVNSTLGESWEIPSESMKSTDLSNRREDYYCGHEDPDTQAYVEPKVPMGGAIITAGVDIQLDRIEASVRIWGLGYESWGLEHVILYGDPFEDQVWGQLNELLNKEYHHPNGMKLSIQKCAIDHGYANNRVVNFCHKRKWPTVMVKGKGGAGIPVHNGKPTHANEYRVPLYNIGTDTIKNTLYQRSFKPKSGPGCIHWNQNYGDKYFEQFTAEKRIKKQVANGFIYVWEKPPGKTNEGLDIEVYNYAALHLIGLGDMMGTIKQIITPPKLEKEDPVMPGISEPNTFTDDL